MGSNRAASPVKIYIVVLAPENVGAEKRLEERLIAEFGPTDHRLSLILSGGSIQRVFLSFDHLIEIDSLQSIRGRAISIEHEFSATLDIGFLDNRRAVSSIGHGKDRVEDEIQFKNGGIVVFSWTKPEFLAGESQEFFLKVRQTYRSQLRNMCLLRR